MAELPLLERAHRGGLRPEMRNCAHPALLLYRFLDGRKPPKEAPEEQRKAFDEIWRLFGGRVNSILGGENYRKLASSLQERQAGLLESLGKRGWSTYGAEFQTSSRLALGLSVGRIWSISFLVHPLWGIPYVPASGIKGAMRRRVTDLGFDANSIFGDETDSPEAAPSGNNDALRASRVMLFDAFPVLPAPPKKVLLEDVLNKHYEDYYENEEPGPPADYCGPTPVKFLTVGRNVFFRFRFAVAPGSEEALSPSPDQVAGWLKDCLERQGVAAKTRAGYGRFRFIRKEE